MSLQGWMATACDQTFGLWVLYMRLLLVLYDISDDCQAEMSTCDKRGFAAGR